MTASALPYAAPDVVTILILAFLFLLLNLVGYFLDRVLYCGLLGQLFIGVAWGSPGGQWLPIATEKVLVDMGYLGLILLVYEGGLSTDLPAVKSNLLLSGIVALTGTATPIAVSFILIRLANATPLQAFAAGAALCSTSLGTTFTVLKSTGQANSRVGVILASAAMLDDVVGLVLVRVISDLGISNSSISSTSIIRPIGVSIAFAVVVPLFCCFVVKPLAIKVHTSGAKPLFPFMTSSQTGFIVHTAVLIGFVVGSDYAGTSDLFAAYLAGACINWYDGEMLKSKRGIDILAKQHDSTKPDTVLGAEVDVSDQAAVEGGHYDDKALKLADKSQQLTSKSMMAIPSLEVPSSAVSTRAIPSQKGSKHGTEDQVNNDQPTGKDIIRSTSTTLEPFSRPNALGPGMLMWQAYYEIPLSAILKPLFFASIGFSIPVSQMFKGSIIWKGIIYALLMAMAKLVCGVWLLRPLTSTAPTPPLGAQKKESRLPKPRSIYPASILGCAMVARGEIGFLISGLAESRGLFSSASASGPSEIFLIVTWAIMLCTIGGPVAVGLLTKRVHKLQKVDKAIIDG